MKIIVVAAGLLLMAAGCGAGEPPHPAASTAVSPATKYATTSAMRDALEDTAAACPSYVEVADPAGPGVLGRAECGDTRMLSVYASAVAAQAGAAGACTAGAVFVIGDNWTVNTSGDDEAMASQRVLGGQIEPC